MSKRFCKDDSILDLFSSILASNHRIYIIYQRHNYFFFGGHFWLAAAVVLQ